MMDSEEVVRGRRRHVGAIEMAKTRCKAVIHRIENELLGCPNKITESCNRTLFKLALSELNFLSSSALPPLSTNIGHLESVVHILQLPFITGVSRVCKPIPLAHANVNGKKEKSATSLTHIHVDIVCTLNKTPVWIFVSDRNPKYVTWQGCHKNKGLRLKIEQVIAATQSSQALKPSSIVLFFSKGLDNLVRDNLRVEFGALELGLGFSTFDHDCFEEPEGEWINVLTKSYQDACLLEIKVETVSSLEHRVKDPLQGQSPPTPTLLREHRETILDNAFCSFISQMNCCSLDAKSLVSAKPELLVSEGDLINYDTTALIALISGISNGCTEKLLDAPESEMRQRFKGNYEFVIRQVMSEVKNPIHVELGGVIRGKSGIICDTVHSEFKELVSMCGGPNEKLRAEVLLKRLLVVPDCPSERMKALPTTRKLALKNKVTFGTGDYWHAPTLTANMAFVRAISQTAMSLSTIEHRPRALTGD